MEVESFNQKTLARFLVAFILVCFGGYYLLSTARFADVDTAQKRDGEFIGPFDSTHEHVQTIRPTAPYFSSVEFSLLSLGYSDHDDFQVFVHLRDHSQHEIASTKYSVPRSSQIYDLRFDFPPQKDSRNKDFFLVLQTDAPPDTVFLLGSEYDTYAAGALTSKDTSIHGLDLAFFTYTTPPPSLLIIQTFRQSGIRFANLFLIALVVFCLGYGVTSLCLRARDFMEFVIYTLLLGVCLSPILLLILSWLQITLEKNLLFTIISGLLLTAIVVKLIRPKREVRSVQNSLQRHEIVILSILCLLAFFTRVSQITGLSVPSGAGSEFHQNILEKMDRTEEIPLDSIYHLGFHTNVFLMHSIMNLGIPEATLLFGQWLSVLSGLSFHLLSRRLFRNNIHALTATAIYWFISPIPAYLINIARYPFLQGLTLLPGTLALFANDEKDQPPNRIVIAILLIGLFLSHYGTTILFAVVMIGMAIYKVSKQRSSFLKQSKSSQTTLKFAAAFLPLFLVIAIKVYYVIQQGSWESFLTSRAITTTFDDYTNTLNHTFQNGGVILWILGISGGLFLFVRHLRLLRVVIICALVLFGSSWLQMMLLGHSASRPTNTLFFLSIPLSILAAYFLEHFSEPRTELVYLFLVCVSLTGAYNISGMVNPRYVFFTHADQQAMQWIRKNVTASSSVVINSYPWDGIFGPTDGGAWIPSLTRRKTVFANTADEYNEIRNFMIQSGADYVYIGSGYGNITPQSMNGMDAILLYSKEGIYIYQIFK